MTQTEIDNLFRLIRQLKKRNISVVYISHFLEEIGAIADRYTVLRDGESVGSGDVSQSSPEKLVSMMVGRDVDDLYPRSPRSDDGERLLEVAQLSGREKPSSASLSVRRGQIVGISGLVGAGRSELLRAIFGLDRVVAGEIRIGSNLLPSTPASRWKESCGFLSEDRKEEGLA